LAWIAARYVDDQMKKAKDDPEWSPPNDNGFDTCLRSLEAINLSDIYPPELSVRFVEIWNETKASNDLVKTIINVIDNGTKENKTKEEIQQHKMKILSDNAKIKIDAMLNITKSAMEAIDSYALKHGATRCNQQEWLCLPPH
jgi:hypothetical protein